MTRRGCNFVPGVLVGAGLVVLIQGVDAVVIVEALDIVKSKLGESDNDSPAS